MMFDLPATLLLMICLIPFVWNTLWGAWAAAILHSQRPRRTRQ